MLTLLEKPSTGTSPMTQWLRLYSPNTEGPSSLACQGTRSCMPQLKIPVSSVQSLSRVQLFATPWTAACQASLSITNSQSFLKLISIESMMPSKHLIFCRPLLLLPSILPRIRVFSNQTVPYIRWPKHWHVSFSISFSSEYSGLISFRIDWLISLQSKGLSRVFHNTIVQKHHFFSPQLPLQSNSHTHT